jgi:hypothetical protein
MRRHRHREFLRFLLVRHRNTDERFDLYLIVDNYAMHKHPRGYLHFTPTSASWPNRVGRFFALVTQESIRRGAFSRAPDLEVTIMAYLEHHNANPKPFVWTASAAAILEKGSRNRC